MQWSEVFGGVGRIVLSKIPEVYLSVLASCFVCAHFRFGFIFVCFCLPSVMNLAVRILFCFWVFFSFANVSSHNQKLRFRQSFKAKIKTWQNVKQDQNHKTSTHCMIR